MSDKHATPVVLADREGIAQAAAILRAGGLVAVPTETVYGLAARADSAEAVARIYAAKGRPSFNPLIVHVPGVAQARRLAEWSETAEALAAEHWPGPLTMVLPRRADAALAEAVTAGLPTVALRAPTHSAMRALLGASALPIAAPSANRSGFISPTQASHVTLSLDGRIDLILDGGASSEGIESTIVAVREGGALELLRPGSLDLSSAGAPMFARVEAPGQLTRHYAPGKPLRLDASSARQGEFLIGFGSVPGDVTLSASGDLTEAAARLYACLHEAAASPHPRIAVAPVPAGGLGNAIRDRLQRAAS
ncbi:MAG: L-threonylcarbamoyladenylate synthase [Erythrobacter sp.]|jgi:L-threonylcarbamoyladenylate synthase|nr:L-threonylcarbamoyladenylate synthase [Erythrobacter sp.]